MVKRVASSQALIRAISASVGTRKPAISSVSRGWSPTELADPGQDAVQLPEDQDRPPYPGGPPAGGGLQIRQHVIEPLPEIRQDVIPIQAHPMSGMESRGGSTHEHRALYEGLEVALGRQQVFPFGTGLLRHGLRIARG